MTNILLTGAGFSRNWGGWLANEVFEYLIGADDLDPTVRRLLWKHKERGTGFEGVYSELRGDTTTAGATRFDQFHLTVSGMFHVMRHGFRAATLYSHILEFLMRFDAIFTLNQDTLLEDRYLAFDEETFRLSSNGVWFGAETPGLAPAQVNPEQYRVPQAGPYEVTERRQPYFKLHGSHNWFHLDRRDSMLILGGGKEAEIAKHPLLAWYHQEFERRLVGNQVVIVGYSFGDEHINRHLCKAAGSGARYFIVDPAGVDVIDKRDRFAAIRQPLSDMQEALMPSIDGASRRHLLSTLHEDHIERRKLEHFLTAGTRRRNRAPV